MNPMIDSGDESDWLCDLQNNLIALGDLGADLTAISPRLQTWLKTAFEINNRTNFDLIQPEQYWLLLRQRIQDKALKSLHRKTCVEVSEVPFNVARRRLIAYYDRRSNNMAMRGFVRGE